MNINDSSIQHHLMDSEDRVLLTTFLYIQSKQRIKRKDCFFLLLLVRPILASQDQRKKNTNEGKNTINEREKRREQKKNGKRK